MFDARRVVVIGNGMVGQRFLEALVAERDVHGLRLEIAVFGEESRQDELGGAPNPRGGRADDLSLLRRRLRCLPYALA